MLDGMSRTGSAPDPAWRSARVGLDYETSLTDINDSSLRGSGREVLHGSSPRASARAVSGRRPGRLRGQPTAPFRPARGSVRLDGIRPLWETGRGSDRRPDPVSD